MRATRPSSRSKMHASRMKTSAQSDLVEIVPVGPRIRLHDLGQRHKTAEQIARRHQVRQKINLQFLSGCCGDGGEMVGGMLFVPPVENDE